jgi:hypothetical protein
LAIVVNDYQRGACPIGRPDLPNFIDLTERTSLVSTPPARRAAPAEGIIYFLQVGGHIKIGWTSDLAKRMHAYPPNALLLATHPGLRKDELRLHKMFAVHRSHGREWYPLAPVILEHIKRVVAKYGKPVEVTFGAKPVEVPQPRPHQYIGGDRIGSGSTPRTVRG